MVRSAVDRPVLVGGGSGEVPLHQFVVGSRARVVAQDLRPCMVIVEQFLYTEHCRKAWRLQTL
jgi:hypothetical protein